MVQRVDNSTLESLSINGQQLKSESSRLAGLPLLLNVENYLPGFADLKRSATTNRIWLYVMFSGRES